MKSTLMNKAQAAGAQVAQQKHVACPACGVVHTFRNGAPKWSSVNQELLEALKELTLRASISLDYAISGRTETRWTSKDKISAPGTLATHDTMIRAVAQAKAALAKAEGKL